MFKSIWSMAVFLVIAAWHWQAAAQDTLPSSIDAVPSFDGLAAGNYIASTFESEAPKTIAIVYVEDARESKEEHPNLRGHFARGLLPGLAQRKYKDNLSIKRVEEKLAAAGLDASAINNPSTEEACRILAADALMRVRLMDRAEKEMVIVKGLTAFVQASLQDCSSREVIWSYNGLVGGSLGFIGARSNYVIAETLATWLAEQIPRRPKRK